MIVWMRSAAVLAAAALLLAACRGNDDDGSDRDDAEESADEGADDASSTGNMLGGPFAMGSLLAAQSGKPGLYELPRESEDLDETQPHFVVLELTGPVVELQSFDWLAGVSGLELRHLLERLRELRQNENVRGIILRTDGLSIDLTMAEELRSALLAFKEGTQRAVLCHTESAHNAAYYALSACDSVGLAPTGEIIISGAAAMPIHLKGLLDKIGMKADFLHIGEYKGAAEPLTREAPSEEMIETIDAILDESYQSLIAGIASGRELSPDVVRTLIDTAVFKGNDAVEAKLVDQIATFPAFRDDVIDEGGWRRVPIREGKQGLPDLMRLLGVEPRTRPDQPHVAVVYALGNVVEGKGDGLLGARRQIAAGTLSAALRRLAREESVAAVVLRIDSGGGSALASELIWHAIRELVAEKPVVVSMGGVAASGGYYIACGASAIYADANTLTGSIGVVGGKLVIEGTLDKLGIEAYPMGRGKRALMWSSIDSWSPGERATVRSMMEKVYETFEARVATGRGMSIEEVGELARGRVWTGAAAADRGLVDEIGGLADAIARARSLGEVAADAPLEYYPPEPSLLDFVGSFGRISAPFGVRATLEETARELGPLEAAAIAETLEQLAGFRGAPVQAALMWPLVIR